MTISNRFFRVDWRESHLFLFVFLFFAPIFSISFNCEILSFFLSSSPRFHHFISSFTGFNAWLHFSSFLPFSHDLFHSQSSFSLSPFPPQFPFFPSSSIEAFYPAKSGQRILPTYSFRPHLFTFHPFYPFISLFSHTFEKTRNSPEQIFNPSYLSRAFQPPKKPKPVVKIQPRARSSIQKGKRIDSSPRNRIETEPSLLALSTLFENSSHPRITHPDRNQIGRPILARDPKLFRFDWQVDRWVTAPLPSKRPRRQRFSRGLFRSASQESKRIL